MTVALRFRGFQHGSHKTLRATFDCRDMNGRCFLAYAELSSEGWMLDLQAADEGRVGPELTHLIQQRCESELVRARAAAVVAEFDAERSGARRRA